MEYVRLGEIATIQTGPFGSQLHQSDYSDTGVPVVMPKDLIGGKIIEDDIARVSQYHAKRLKRHRLEQGNIVYARRGDVGRCAFVSEKNHGSLCGTGCFRVEIHTGKADPQYVFLRCQSEDVVEWVRSRAVGSTLPNLNTGILSRIPLLLPSLPTQRKIASILSAYDSLIENNSKRIRLLEQMAENLYKEWFVRFRFPGHQNTKMINGLPEGWKKDELRSICEFKRGKNITSDEMVEGDVPVIAAGITPSGFHNIANVSGTSITMSSSGANAGYIGLHYQDIWAADCSYVSESDTDDIYYVYELLNNLRVVINNLQRGAAQPHVYAKDVNSLKLVLPNKELRELANKKFAMIHSQIYNLQQQSALLTRQRDLLLPRLMSGKLEVCVGSQK